MKELPTATIAAYSKHYDDKYFLWQRSYQDFGAWANYHKFSSHIRPTDRVLDFGCGSGALLAGIQCAEKYGVEPNPAAAAEARQKGLKVFSSSSELTESSVDIVISNSALEHTLHPLVELQNLHRCLVANGKIVVVVPCENIIYAYKAGDINHHLYSWSPMALGNLLEEAGFFLVESKSYIHKWPPFYKMWGHLGWPTFNILCRIYGQLNRKLFQVRAIATKGLEG